MAKNDSYAGQLIDEIKALKNQIEKMKCCFNCRYHDTGNCKLSPNEKDNYTQWHYPSRMENGKFISENPVSDFYPIEILMYSFPERKFEIIKYDIAWGYFKRNGDSLSNRTNFIWQYLNEPQKEIRRCEYAKQF